MSVTYKLFTEDQIKNWYTANGTSDYKNANESSKLQTIMNGIVVRAEQYCNRKFEYIEDFVEHITPSGNALYPNRLPLVQVTNGSESYHLLSVVPLIDGEYDADNEVPVTDYYVDLDENVIRLKSGCMWAYRKYRVIYNGGYNKYGSTENALPDDLAQALLTQLKFDFENKEDIGVSSKTDVNGNFTKLYAFGFLPGVLTILDKYRIL